MDCNTACKSKSVHLRPCLFLKECTLSKAGFNDFGVMLRDFARNGGLTSVNGLCTLRGPSVHFDRWIYRGSASDISYQDYMGQVVRRRLKYSRIRAFLGRISLPCAFATDWTVYATSMNGFRQSP